MPQQMWKHTCRKDGSSYSIGSLVCSTCAGPGTYDGWHPRMREAMALYQTRYRLKPIGPHRRMTDDLFAAVRATCPACAGRGLLDIVGGRSWQVCSTCRGFGSYFTKPTDEIEALRSRVLAAYPDAAANPVPDIFTGPGAFSGAKQEVVNLSQPATHRAKAVEGSPSGPRWVVDHGVPHGHGPNCSSTARPAEPRCAAASWGRRGGRPTRAAGSE
jgi:hypothetical protein